MTAGRPYVIGAVLSLLVAAESAAGVAEAAAQDRPGAVGQLAPLVFQGLRSPIPFKGSDGRTHLAYVVTIQNSGPVPVKINKVAVLDAHRDMVISSVSGKGLVGRLGLLATPVAPLEHATLGSSQAGAYWVDVILKPGAPVPKRLQHRITATPVGPSFYEGRDTVTAAPLAVSKKKAVRLVPPLAGERWVDLTGCCTGVPNHRHALFASAGKLYDAQEFAIDFMRFDAQDRLWVGDRSDPKDYIVYGAPVLAVADATVVAMTNNLPDQRPLSPSAVPPAEADGNFIMLDLGDGRYANYAHLAPGSVTVKVGEQVKAGQQMALIGNSGQTGAPHLHFHVMDRPLLAEANGLPYEFDAFTVRGVARLNSIDRALTTGGTTRMGPVGRGAHANELPLELAVLDFPAPRPGASTAAASTRSASSASIAWKPCGKRLQCARVPVPLDWARPDGRQIELALARYRARGPGRPIGSLFFNPGGPGNLTVPFIRAGGDVLSAYGRGRFDVVGWDIRGSAGSSTAVSCFSNQRRRARFWGRPSVPNTAQQARSYRRKTADFARRCGRRSGPLLRHISAADQARDLDHLRRLVGDRRLNYYGVSYGTFLGQTYANMFPDRVRAMIIDGVVDPVPYARDAASAVADNVVDSDRVLRGFAQRCEAAGPERCALIGHGPVQQRVEELLARVRRGPLPAPSADPPGALTYADLQSALFAQLGHPDAWPQLAEWLDAAADGDGSALATEGRKGYTGFRASQNGDGFSALWCADSPAAQGSRAWPSVMRRLDAASSTRGTLLGWYAWGPCASWPTGSPDRYTGPWNATTRNPVLVMGIDQDPNTPFRNARSVSRRLGNAVLLKQRGFGHGTYTDPSACMTRQMGAYLVDLQTPTRRVCPSDRDPFDPDFGLPLP